MCGCGCFKHVHDVVYHSGERGRISNVLTGQMRTWADWLADGAFES